MRLKKSKLEVYGNIKNIYGLERYLVRNLTCKQKIDRPMCKFRISAHRLPIESGRYLKIKRVDRKCIECNKVGDEMHYFLDWTEQEISICRQTLFPLWIY